MFDIFQNICCVNHGFMRVAMTVKQKHCFLRIFFICSSTKRSSSCMNIRNQISEAIAFMVLFSDQTNENELIVCFGSFESILANSKFEKKIGVPFAYYNKSKSSENYLRV